MARKALKMARPETKRRRMEILRSQLENEVASFKPHWRQLAEFISPRRQEFLINDQQKGAKKGQSIIDTSPSLAARTLSAGMMGGVTSPARPWFRLTTPDPDMAEFGRVKNWLDLVTRRMVTVLLKSNVYNTLPTTYKDLGVYATSCMSVEEDFKNVIHSRSYPIGSYMIAVDSKARANIFFEHTTYTVRQLLDEFGRSDEDENEIDWSRFSSHVKSLYDNHNTEARIEVCHVVQPNEDYDPEKIGSRYKKFLSCYYERGRSSSASSYTDDLEDKYLREAGFDLFPILAPRWEVTGNVAYGTDCPGMTALADIKQLMHGEKKGLMAIDKLVSPPMRGGPELENRRVSSLPGEVTIIPRGEPDKALSPIYQVDPKIQELEGKQAQVRYRVSRAFFEDLFLMISQDQRNERATAREIEERHEEKLLALGPVLEQLNQDLLDPLIDLTFDIMNRQGLIPPPPPELAGVELKVEYISIMAQAQKIAGLGGIERFKDFVGSVVEITQDKAHMDKVNVDEMIDKVGDITGIPPSIIRPQEEVDAIRAERAKVQQAAATAQVAEQAAGAAKDLSEADMTQDSALTRLAASARAGQLAPQ